MATQEQMANRQSKFKARKARHDMRREENRQRDAEYRKERDKLSPAAKIKLLDHRLGKNVGAKKERARLLKQGV